MRHNRFIFLFTALFACACPAQAQQMNRPIGQYPGNPSEYYGPVIMNGQGRCTFEYLSKFHTVYQSSSWDFNLTSQLLTDGIIDDQEPAWLNVTTPEGPLPPHKREACIDGNEWTSNILMGGNTWLQYDWEGMAIDIDEVEMLCTMAYREDAPKGFKIRLLISKDGKNGRSPTSGKVTHCLVSHHGSARTAILIKTVAMTCCPPAKSSTRSISKEKPFPT